MTRLALALVVAAGCKFDPSGIGAGGGAGGAGGMVPDGSGGMSGSGGSGGMPDAMRDAALPDARIDAANGVCLTVGERICITPTQSGHCELLTGGVLQPIADRDCPPTSQCSSGYCQPPGSAISCMIGNDCPGTTSCDLYVQSGSALVGFCTVSIGTGGGIYQSCNSDAQCKSATCTIDSGGNSICFYKCGNNGDCLGGGTCKPFQAPAQIEGVSTNGIKSCF